MTYANICIFLAILCFVVDGLGFGPQLHLISWGSVFFAAAFITWESEKNSSTREALEERHGQKKQPGETKEG